MSCLRCGILAAFACWASCIASAAEPVADEESVVAQVDVNRSVVGQATDLLRVPGGTMAGHGTGGGVPSLLPPPPLADVADSHGCEWFVSTRGFQQTPDGPGRYGYSVFVRRDGHLRASSLSEMTGCLSPDIPTLVFIHGSYVDWPWFQRESRVTTAWIRETRPDLPLQIVYFTWPSDSESCLAAPAVRRLERQAEFNAFILADIAAALPVEGAGGGQLTLLGHSHGAMMAAATCHLLGGGVIEGRGSCGRVVWKPQLILAAAALDRDWLSPAVRANRFLPSTRFTGSGRYEKAVHVCSQIVILKNHWDAALMAYPIRRPLAKKPLGRVGLTCWDARSLGPHARIVREVDVSRTLGCRHVWPYYVEQASIAHAIAPAIFGQ